MTTIEWAPKDLEKVSRAAALLAKQAQIQNERTAALMRSPAFDALMKNFEAHNKRMSGLTRLATPALERINEIQASLERAGVQLAPKLPDLRATIPKLPDFRVSLPNMREINDRLGTTTLDVVASPDAALEWATDDVAEIPDSWAAIPVVAGTLSPARKRELVLRVATLVAFAYGYVKVLRDSSASPTAPDALVATLLALGWLYHCVLAAIEDAASTLAAEDDES